MKQRDRQRMEPISITQPDTRTGLVEQNRDRWIGICLRAQDKNLVFNNLLTHVNVETLKEAFKAMDGSKALGVDKVSKKKYGKNLEANIQNLTDRIHKGSYRPEPKREVLIPKANGKTRPIAIACFEDKLVDYVVGKILSRIFEPLFTNNSFGFRPRKSADDAIKACFHNLKDDKRPNVVEIDFSSFFNTIPHRQLMDVLNKRISDKRFNGLIGRFLVGDLIGADGLSLPSVIGTPQGGIMSPVLANIYLNEVIDQWFSENFANQDKVMVRYADDAVFFFKEETDAVAFMIKLEERVKEYGLSLNKDKTQIIDFKRGKQTSFNFLGFTFYWFKQNKTKPASPLRVKTQKEKLIKSFQEFDNWIKDNRSILRTKMIWKLAKLKLTGHYNYYGFWMNRGKLLHFYMEAVRSLFKWLNRRSQKISYTWNAFKEKLRQQPLPMPAQMDQLKSLGWNPYAN